MNILVSLFLCGIAGLILMAVPPLSPGQLKSESELVVVGTVTECEVKTVERGHHYIDRVFVFKIDVASIEKGQSRKGAIVEATTWQPDYRPRAWAGPQGQHVAPASGQKVRAYLRKDQEGKYELLMPNGLEVITPAPSTTPAPSPATQPATSPSK